MSASQARRRSRQGKQPKVTPEEAGAEFEEQRNLIVAWTLNATRAMKRAALFGANLVWSGVKWVGNVFATVLKTLWAYKFAIFLVGGVLLSGYMGIMFFKFMLAQSPVLLGLYILFNVALIIGSAVFGMKATGFFANLNSDEVRDRTERVRRSQQAQSDPIEATVIPT